MATSNTPTGKLSTSTRKTKIPPTPSNYMMIQLDWNETLVLPFDDGVMFLKSLERAETYSNRTGERGITPYKSNIRTEILSRADYERYKMAQLLGVDPDDLPENFNSEAT